MTQKSKSCLYLIYLSGQAEIILILFQSEYHSQQKLSDYCIRLLQGRFTKLMLRPVKPTVRLIKGERSR